MQLGHSADEIKYVETKGTLARYIVILDSEPTMHVLCDTSDADKTIYVAPAVGKVEAMPTKGQFTMTEVFTEDADGMPLGVEKRVDEKSVYTYVIPRLYVLLGRLLRAA